MTDDKIYQIGSISTQDFAEEVCQDYNTIHNTGAEKQVVPGDYLVSSIVVEKGLPAKNTFRFVQPIYPNSSFKINDRGVYIIDDSGRDRIAITKKSYDNPLDAPRFELDETTTALLDPEKIAHNHSNSKSRLLFYFGPTAFSRVPEQNKGIIASYCITSGVINEIFPKIVKSQNLRLAEGNDIFYLDSQIRLLVNGFDTDNLGLLAGKPDVKLKDAALDELRFSFGVTDRKSGDLVAIIDKTIKSINLGNN